MVVSEHTRSAGTKRGVLLALAATAIAVSVLMLPACNSEKEPDPGDPRVSLIQVSSLSGRTSYGVTVELGEARSLEAVEVLLGLPPGTGGTDGGTPAGAEFTGVSGGAAHWTMSAASGPAIIGPFVFLPEGKAGPPKSAEVKWSGGSVKTAEAKVRQAGVALGEGVLRPAATTSVILIGRETEITGYAVGGSLNPARAVLATRDPVDPPPPAPNVAEATVMTSHFRIEPAAVNPIVLEMTAPRPLPPYALLAIDHAPNGGEFTPFKYGGRVGPLGDRIFVPVSETGKYRARIEGEWYRRAFSPMSSQVLSARALVTGRASQVAFEIKPEFVPALAEVDSDETIELLSVERARPSVVIPESIPEGLSFNGLAACSIVACIGANAPYGAVSFCDLVHDITACIPIDRPGEEVTVTVTGRDPLFQYCQERACYVPGNGIVEGASSGAALEKPVSVMVSGREIVWIGVPVAG